jgi:hypothetical protein
MGSHVPPQAEEDLEFPSDPVEYALFRHVQLRHGDYAASPILHHEYRFCERSARR